MRKASPVGISQIRYGEQLVLIATVIEVTTLQVSLNGNGVSVGAGVGMHTVTVKVAVDVVQEGNRHPVDMEVAIVSRLQMKRRDKSLLSSGLYCVDMKLSAKAQVSVIVVVACPSSHSSSVSVSTIPSP